MLTILKRMRGHKEGRKGRIMNIFLCSLQIITPIFGLICVMILLCQESKLSNITKDYITIAFVMDIDNKFAEMLPKEVLKNA